jgi:hypothetical protein
MRYRYREGISPSLNREQVRPSATMLGGVKPSKFVREEVWPSKTDGIRPSVIQEIRSSVTQKIRSCVTH